METLSRIIKAVFIKDFKILMRYKLNLIMTVVSVAMYCTVIFYMSETFTFKDLGYETALSDKTFLYFLTGIILIDLTITCSSSLPLTVSFYQTSGIFEEILSKQRIFFMTIISSIALPFCISMIKFCIYLFFSKYIFGINLALDAKIIMVLPMLILYMISIIGIGLIAASITIIFKRGNPVIQLNNILTATIAGTFIPSNQFGSIIGSLSEFLPAKVFIDSVRLTMDTAVIAESSEIYTKLIYLMLISLTILLIGFLSFYKATNYAKLKNIITDY